MARPQPNPNAERNQAECQCFDDHDIAQADIGHCQRALQMCHRTDQVLIGRVRGEIEQIILNKIPWEVKDDRKPERLRAKVNQTK